MMTDCKNLRSGVLWSILGLFVGCVNYISMPSAKADCTVTKMIYLKLDSVICVELDDADRVETEAKKWGEEAAILENWFSTDNFGLLISLERGQ